MTIATKTTRRPPPTNLRKSATIGLLPRSTVRLGGRTASWSGATMRPVPAIPVTSTGVPAGMSTVAVALNSCVWPSALTRTLPSGPAGIATATDAVRPTRSGRERLGALGPPEQREQDVDEAEADGPEHGPDDGRLAAVDVEHLRREQAADPEHRHERQQRAASATRRRCRSRCSARRGRRRGCRRRAR